MDSGDNCPRENFHRYKGSSLSDGDRWKTQGDLFLNTNKQKNKQQQQKYLIFSFSA